MVGNTIRNRFDPLNNFLFAKLQVLKQNERLSRTINNFYIHPDKISKFKQQYTDGNNITFSCRLFRTKEFEINFE